ncbi:MAG TPA: OmpA family protein [Melioribacteraceae bacterium]|nr:OmpA family protein [Melioribacteraceae bacterium]
MRFVIRTVFVLSIISNLLICQELKTYSDYNFVPGEKVIFYDDFSFDNIGEFPSNWNTTGSGEVVTTNLFEGKWLKLTNETAYVPNLNQTLPECFTIEFDMVVDGKMIDDIDYLGHFTLGVIAKEKDNEEIGEPYPSEMGTASFFISNYFRFEESSDFMTEGSVWMSNGDRKIIDPRSLKNNVLNKQYNKITRVSILVNGKRLSVWYNNVKIWDLPQFVIGNNYNMIKLGLHEFDDEKPYTFLISNFRVAIGETTLKKDIKKIISHGINFDSGSDKIKGESFGTLKSIAEFMKQNINNKYTIIGHTDSDGDDKANLELSKRRAEAVKDALINIFGLNADRFLTDGKGENEPLESNNNAFGKSINRRVEFIRN